MNALRSLAGLAVVSILVVAVGAAVSLAGALGDVARVATGVLLAAVVLAIIGAGVGGAGGPNRRTPYW